MQVLFWHRKDWSEDDQDCARDKVTENGDYHRVSGSRFSTKRSTWENLRVESFGNQKWYISLIRHSLVYCKQVLPYWIAISVDDGKRTPDLSPSPYKHNPNEYWSTTIWRSPTTSFIPWEALWCWTLIWSVKSCSDLTPPANELLQWASSLSCSYYLFAECRGDFNGQTSTDYLCCWSGEWPKDEWFDLFVAMPLSTSTSSCALRCLSSFDDLLLLSLPKEFLMDSRLRRKK